MSNVPKLRFKEFSGGWETTKIGSLGTFQGGGTPTTSEERYWTGNIPWISSSDIIDGDIKNINISRFINETSIKESATKLIPKDSILFVSRVGVGKLAIAPSDLCTSQDFSNLTLKDNSSYFIASYFLSKSKLLERYSQGTSIKGFTTGDLKTLKLNLPSKQEQEKIASFLNQVDTKIEQLTKKEKLLRQYKKGVMQKIFNKEIRFKDDDGSEFCEWEEKKLKEVTCKKSSNISANSLEENIGQYKIYGATGHLKNVDFYTEDKPYISIVKDGAGVGRVLLCDAKSSVLGTLDIIQNNHNMNLYFIYLLLARIHFEKYIVGSTIPHIYYKDYSNEKIQVPCIEEQNKIANFLSSIDTKIEQVQKQLKQTKEFKKALLQQMFV